VHNGPAYPAGECDCGVAPKSEREALKLALEALKTLMLERGSIYEQAITAIKEALAQPAQEPVAQWLEDAFREGWEAYRESEFASKITEDWAFGNSFANCRMIDLQQNTPPQRPWVGLTDEDIHGTFGYNETRETYQFALALIAKLKEKNS
jgi:hypothetical protein